MMREMIRLMRTGEEYGFKIQCPEELEKSFIQLANEFKNVLEMIKSINEYKVLLDDVLKANPSEDVVFSVYIYVTMMIKTFFPSLEALKNTPDIIFIPYDNNE